MRSFDDLSEQEKWNELMCRIARIEDALEIDEEEEPMPDRVRDNLREDLHTRIEQRKREQA